MSTTTDVGQGVDGALLAEVRGRLVRSGGVPSTEHVMQVVRECGAVLGSRALADLVAVVRAELLGAGPLQGLLEEPDVTDVLVNGPRDVWVERAGRLEQVDVDLGTAEQVRTLAVRLAAAGGQRLDDASPVVDARLPDGSRLHAVLPPVGGACTLLSLRVLRRRAFTLADLLASGGVAPALEPVLRGLVASRANVLISGATGTGKTTLLATLLSLVPADERIVCIEEAGELEPDHPHVVRLLARRANVEGVGEVGLPDLVRHALRMRPDRIVLGECRGAEVREVLTALNTGHEGGWATVHANTAADVPARLEALAALAGMGRESVAAQASSALDAVLHLRRDGGRRRLAEIGVVRRGGAGELVVVPALTVRGAGEAAGVAGTEGAGRAAGPGAEVDVGPGWELLAARVGLADPQVAG
ncbi:TadA family conjugal transfer-associated ATPase [Pengzhenrongella frigida]|uniref:TadA family conjugal transfer-associated ATPase n=1 Tax=Pengzhenrongella frigida TaxID=1259133 RepID=A0A4V1ZGQ7_9MICO|nr:TadA family conjugal transfer-associated ATPase [Cellulomonas sp. HLT2-17]RYV49384.1 TadA family conjugal transfer-associated ATPase [Cellulomonas sp. HLT2-17]